MAETTVATIGVEVPIEREKELCEAATELEIKAGALCITSEEDYKSAGALGRMIKERTSQIKDFFKPLKDATHKTHAEICGKEKAALKPLETAEKLIKSAMATYIEEQEKKRREAEESARRAAQAEMERKLSEAVALSAQGKQEEADAAFEEAAIMDDVSATIALDSSKPKAEGVSVKRDWEIVSIDSSKVPTEINGVEIRPVDTAAVMRLIRASKGAIKIEGIIYKETAQMSFRK